MTARQCNDLELKPAQTGGHHVIERLPTAPGGRPTIAEEHLPGHQMQPLRQVVILAQQVFANFREELRPMTPERVKSIREELGLSQAALGQLLRLGAHGKRTVARWEAGEPPVPGPASVALEALESGWRPGDGKWTELRQAYLTVLDAIDIAVSQARERVQSVGSEKEGGLS